MKIFLSWSGERSKRVAELLKDWLPDVIQSVKPWFSADDIQRGALWLKAINDELAKTYIGIVCLTQSNKNAPWILFESGSLAKGNDSSRICTLLIDLKDSDLIKHPLTHFNHTKPDEGDLLKLVKTINSSLETPLEEPKLERALKKNYPDFKERFENILAETNEEEPEKKEVKTDDVLEEVLRSIRNIENKIIPTDEKYKQEASMLNFENGRLRKQMAFMQEEFERNNTKSNEEFQKRLQELNEAVIASHKLSEELKKKAQINNSSDKM